MNDDPSLNLAALLLSGLFFGIIFGSIFRWIQVLRTPKASTDGHGQAEAAPAFPRWGLSIVDFVIVLGAFLILFFFAQNLVAAGYYHLTGEELSGDDIGLWVAVALSAAIQVPLIVSVFGARQLAPKTYGTPLSVHRLSWVRCAWMAGDYLLRFLPLIMIAGALWALLLAELVKLGVLEDVPLQVPVQLFTAGGEPLALLSLAFFAVVVAPIAEEYFFRGFIFRFFADRMALWMAILSSGLLFSLIHWNLHSFIGLLFVGILLAVIYQKSGNLRVPILFHAFFNATSLLLLFLSTKVPGFE